MGTVCDQTIWMRKRRMEAHVGGCILEVQVSAMGGLGRVKHEFFPFYDAGYYRHWDYRDMFDA
jgi:hypothetical protein